MFSEGYDKSIKEIAFVQGETFFPLSFPLSFIGARVEERTTSASVYLAIGVYFYLFFWGHFSQAVHSLSMSKFFFR